MTRLAELLVDVKPGFASGDDLVEGTFQLRMHNLTRGSILDLSKRRRVGPTARQLDQQSISTGDVLFNATNSPELVGKSALITALDEPTVFSNHFLRLRTDREKLDPSYLAHFLRFQFLIGTFRAMAKAWVNQATVSRERLVELDLPLPRLDEQRRIAAILDSTGRLAHAGNCASERLGDLSAAMYRQWFGSTDATTQVGCVASDIRTGPFGSQLLHSEFVDSGVPVLGIDNAVENRFRWGARRYITEAKYQQLKRYTVSPGDVLITIMGTCGRCAVVPNDIGTAINTKHLCAITVDSNQMLPEFLWATFLWHPASRRHLAKQAKGAIMSGLNMGIIKQMPVPVPPLSVQHQFVRTLHDVERRRAASEARSRKLNELSVAVQAEAFRPTS